MRIGKNRTEMVALGNGPGKEVASVRPHLSGVADSIQHGTAYSIQHGTAYSTVQHTARYSIQVFSLAKQL
jgi:hypothetical protein